MSDYTGISWTWIEEWSQFFGRNNWYTFRPIMFEVEDDRHMGGIEATVIVMGLGFRVRWNYAETDDLHEIKRQAAFVIRDLELQDKAAASPETLEEKP